MIPGANYGHLFDIDFLYLIFGFGGMLWQSFYPLLTKEPKDFCFSENKSIALSIQSCCKDLLALMKDSFREIIGVVELKIIL